MAKADNNIFVRGLTGAVGNQFVLRRGRNGTTIVANKPSFVEGREFNENQLAHQKAFQHAVAYAQTAKTNELYVRKARGTSMTAFNAAVKDWFSEPRILEIDASGWQGVPGDEIHVLAMDDTLVTEVHVSISDESGVVLEEGYAERAEGLWWTYTANTTVPMEPTPHVVASAQDMPGNSAELAWQN
jgi:hypothetical protein